MNKWQYYIPSFGRAGEVSTIKKIPFAKIVIPKSQYKDYLKYHDKKSLFIIPDNRDGSVPRKRNAILDLTPEKRVVMVDDDLKTLRFIAERSELNKKEIIEITDTAFEMCRELDINYWGFNWNGQPLHYRSDKPISLDRFFYSWFGIIKTELRYDEKVERCDDIDFWMQHSFRDRRTLSINYIHASFRTKDKKQNRCGLLGVHIEGFNLCARNIEKFLSWMKVKI